MNNPRVFIIIVNYNSWRDTLQCLESLTKISYKSVKALIIDNHSSDASIEKIEHFLKKNQVLQAISYRLPANLGFAGGNNDGIKKALKEGADYLLLLNPDTIVKPDFLSILIDVAENWKKQKKHAFFGPRILLNESRIYSNGGKINWSQTKGILKDYRKPLRDLKETEPFNTDYVSGTCILVSKDVIKKIGLMREDYFLYYEDTDWAIRARTQGISSVIVPKSVIWHKMSATTKEGSYEYIYYHTRNGLYCGWFNGNPFQKAAVLLLSIWIFLKQPIKILLILLPRSVGGGLRKRQLWAFPVMRGIIDFWKGNMGNITSPYAIRN